MTKPRVKPLEWRKYDIWDREKAKEYTIQNEKERTGLNMWSAFKDSVFFGNFATPEAAKAAAQADYEARILSALDLTPDPAVQALDNKEQLDIWAQEILEGLAFADVLKIESYEDKIEAHYIIGRGIVEVLRSVLAMEKPHD